MFHVNGWGHIYAITGMGARHICTRGVDVEAVFDRIRAEDVSYFCAAPTVLNMLGDHYADHGGATTGDNDVRAARGRRRRRQRSAPLRKSSAGISTRVRRDRDGAARDDIGCQASLLTPTRTTGSRSRRHRGSATSVPTCASSTKTARTWLPTARRSAKSLFGAIR